MTQPRQIPDTPKEHFRVIRVLFAAITGGMVLVAIAALVAAEMGVKPRLPDGEDNSYVQIIGVIIGVACLLLAMSSYKKGVAAIKDSVIPLQDKLNKYRLTLIKYLALCEAAALSVIIAFFITGAHGLFGIAGVALAAMLSKMPTRRRLTNDLLLDWQQKQELS